MILRLSILHRDKKLQTRSFNYEYTQSRITIGRADCCTIQLCDPEVASLHAVITRENMSYFWIDRSGSEARADRRCSVRRRLQSGDCMHFGPFIVMICFDKPSPAPIAACKNTQPTRDIFEAEAAPVEIIQTITEILSLRPYIQVTDGFEQGRRVILTQLDQTYYTGSGSDCDLILPDPGVSKQHAVIRWGEAGVTIEAASPSTGIIFNDKLTDSLVDLHHLDIVGIGSVHLQLINELEVHPLLMQAPLSSTYESAPDDQKREEKSAIEKMEGGDALSVPPTLKADSEQGLLTDAELSLSAGAAEARALISTEEPHILEQLESPNLEMRFLRWLTTPPVPYFIIGVAIIISVACIVTLALNW